LTTTNSAITLNSPTSIATSLSMTAGTGTITAGSLAAGANALTLSGDQITFTGGAGSVTGTGAIVLQPGTAVQNIVINGAGGSAALDLTAAETAALANGFSSITIGRADGTGAIDINAVTFQDPVTVRSPGGLVAVNGQLTGLDTVSVVGGSVALAAPVIASGQTVTLTAAAGAITGAVGAQSDLTAANATLTAATTIGTAANPITTTIDQLIASTSAGGIYITDTDALTIRTVTARGGDAVLATQFGDLTIRGNTVISTTGGVQLTAQGSILAGTTGSHVVAATDSSLTALTGWIGTLANPLQVSVTGGSLSVSAGGASGSYSVVINGSVLPQNFLTIVGTLPGGCLFNGAFCFGTFPAGVTIPGTIFAYLNPLTSETSVQGLLPAAPAGPVQYVCQSVLRTKCRLLIGDPLLDGQTASAPSSAGISVATSIPE
ncbi:MAG TPA: hypothetical protein VFA38_10925, partial [Nitrospirales bacterium]|nr:hypothetical protein [Nitrospirales bacterium]